MFIGSIVIGPLSSDTLPIQPSLPSYTSDQKLKIIFKDESYLSKFMHYNLKRNTEKQKEKY